MKKIFKNIGVISKPRGSEQTLDTLHDLIDYLLNRQLNVLLESSIALQLPHYHFPHFSRSELGYHCDLVIVVGGDGSLLNAARSVVDAAVPVLGINRGSLGFLTDINPDSLAAQLDEIFTGQYSEEQRFLLAVTLQQQQQTVAQDTALNDVVLSHGQSPHMIEFEIYINNRFVCSQRADGLIIATPTGSTAYALSGGGPILHPELNAIVLVPMFPHTLTSRPIVIEADCEIKICIPESNQSTPQISCDGQTQMAITAQHEIIVTKKQQQLRLIHPISYHYFETLRSKLHWGTKL